MSDLSHIAALVRTALATADDVDAMAQISADALAYRLRTILDGKRAGVLRGVPSFNQALIAAADLYAEAVHFLALYRDPDLRFCCQETGPALLMDVAAALCGAELRLHAATATSGGPVPADALPDDLAVLAPALGLSWAMNYRSPSEAIEVAGLALRARLAGLIDAYAGGGRGHALGEALTAYIDVWRVIEGQRCADVEDGALLPHLLAGRLCERLIGAELRLSLAAVRACRADR